MMKWRRSVCARAAFSLVEVALALGIAGFTLVLIVGLLPVAVNTNQAASEQTVANGILSAVIADLRATTPTVPRGQAATSAQYAIAIPASDPTRTVTVTKTLLLNTERQLLPPAAGPARYRVTIDFLPATGAGAKTATMMMAKVSWPGTVDPATATPAGSASAFAALDRN